MNFIQKMIQQKKLEKEEQLKREYCYSMINIEKCISILKDDIKTFSIYQKNITPELICDFMHHMIHLEAHYDKFLHDLKQEEFTYKETYFKNVKEESKKKAEFMHKMKKQYRVEFEKIYDNFKRISKGCNFPRRNEILSKMRTAFDFDSNKYYGKFLAGPFTIMR